MKTLYLAYGSNLNLEQMKRRCPTAKKVGTTILEDYKLTFQGGYKSAVATIKPEKDSTVPVLIWKLEKEDEAALDRYEGWPRLYRKETLQVMLNGKKTDVMVYIMNDGYPVNEPSVYYYSTIRKGYKDNNLDVKSLDKAVDEVIGVYLNV